MEEDYTFSVEIQKGQMASLFKMCCFGCKSGQFGKIIKDTISITVCVRSRIILEFFRVGYWVEYAAPKYAVQQQILSCQTENVFSFS